MRRHVLTLDLREGDGIVEAYCRHHRSIPPAVVESLRAVGVEALDIYRLERRLVMVLDTADDFDLQAGFARHAASDPRCAEWEALMKTFQQPPPGAGPGELWTLMEPVFHLDGRA
jgi:L-rhamnose mutarotase